MDGQHVRLCLVHDGAQPGTQVPEPVRFGLQDSKGEVHPGRPLDETTHRRRFEVAVRVKGDGEGGPPVFSGPFCHGSPASRFLYLSWKRQGIHAAPWAWRIKIPLSGIGWPMIQEANGPGLWIEADVTGRRPHATEAVAWRIAAQETGTAGQKLP